MCVNCKPSPDMDVVIRGDGELGSQNALARIAAGLLHDVAALRVQGTPPDLDTAAVQRNLLQVHRDCQKPGSGFGSCLCRPT